VIGRVLLVVALTVATVKLVVVQTVQAGELSAASARQATTNIALPAARGAILDRGGAPLAFSVDARSLVTNPRTIALTHGPDTAAYVDEMATEVALATGQDRAGLHERLSADRAYVVLARLVDPAVADALRKRFPEIAEERREDRQYPAGDLAANIVGWRPGGPTSASWPGWPGWSRPRTTPWPGPTGCASWTPRRAPRR
jgi:cell division protein FtsI (penicillin-binding protein 3)